MPIGRQEHFHHTREQLAEALRDALEIMRGEGLEPIDNPELARGLLDHRLAKQIVMEQVQPGLPLMQIPRG